MGRYIYYRISNIQNYHKFRLTRLLYSLKIYIHYSVLLDYNITFLKFMLQK